VLAHRVSITMEADFCVEALQEAATRWGAPEIVNTDQGSQFSSCVFRRIVTADFGIVTAHFGHRDRAFISAHRDRPFRDRDRPFRRS
jgi:transposase InsO family protein